MIKNADLEHIGTHFSWWFVLIMFGLKKGYVESYNLPFYPNHFRKCGLPQRNLYCSQPFFQLLAFSSFVQSGATNGFVLAMSCWSVAHLVQFLEVEGVALHEGRQGQGRQVA